MPVSKYKKQQIEKMQKQADTLYKQGFSVRAIGKVLGVSHTYIWKLLKTKGELSTGKS